MKKWTKILIAALGVVVVAIIIYNVYILFNPNYSSDFAESGTIEEVVQADGVVLRNESVVLDRSDVIVSQTVMNGDRVSKGEKLADVYFGEISQEVQAALRETNEKIANLENLASRSNADTESSLDGMLKTYSADIINAAHKSSGSELYRIRGNIDEVINRKIVSNAENAKKTIDKLKAEKAELEGKITGEKNEVFSESSGLFFSSIDGYEGKIGTDCIDTLTPSALSELMNTKKDSTSQDSQMKVTDGYNWYVAATVDEGKLATIRKICKNGQSISLRFGEYGQEKYPAFIEHVSEPENGKIAIVCKGSEYCEAVYYNRFLSVDVILNEYTGLKVPKEAVCVVNGKTGVYVLKSDSTAAFREAEVLASDGSYSVLKEDNMQDNSVILYDEVILAKGPIQDGDYINVR